MDQKRFCDAKHRQGSWKVEEESQTLAGTKSGFDDQRFQFERRNRDSVTIERDAIHDHARAGVPWVVLEKRQIPAGLERSPDQTQSFGPILRRDVMEDAVYVTQIEGRQIAQRGEMLERDTVRPITFARVGDRFFRKIHSHYLRLLEDRGQVVGGGSYAAPEVQHPRGTPTRGQLRHQFTNAPKNEKMAIFAREPHPALEHSLILRGQIEQFLSHREPMIANWLTAIDHAGQAARHC